MEKEYLCLSYNVLTNQSKFVLIREMNFEGDRGPVHIIGLNQKDFLLVDGRYDLGSKEKIVSKFASK